MKHFLFKGVLLAMTIFNLLIHLVMPERLPVGHHPCLAVALSAAKPTDCSHPLSPFPDRESSTVL